MKYIKTLTVVFFFFLLNQAGAFAQITVIIQQPPPYQFKVEHMWKVTLVNPTRTTFTVSLHGRATESTEGLIVDATSSTFALPPGTKIIIPRELVPINIRDANPRYRDVVQNIGGVPTGDYEICVAVINAENGAVLGEQCIQSAVQNLTQVELLEPGNGAVYSFHGRTNDEVWNQPLRRAIAPVVINKGLRLRIFKGPDGSSTAYMMGDPVPGVDIELEQRPGGTRIPVKGWDEYMQEVGIKEEGVKFAEVRVVTDTGGSTIAYLMGDPVPGVDISLQQIPGGMKIPLKGPDEYLQERTKGPNAVNVKKAMRLMIIQNPEGSSTAYMMGDPVPGIDIELEQRPGGIKIPVKGWNEYIREVGIKEEGVKFAEVRVVTDTGGSTIAYLMGDPVSGVDISLEQIPGGIKIPLKGPDEYMREVGIKEEGVKRVGSAIGSIPIVGGVIAGSADVIITQGLNRTAMGSYLIFNWLPPTPIPPGARVTYRLRIAEIYGRQSPYDAIRSNPAFFDNSSIISTIYQYPVAARPFQSGKRYAWKVDVYLNNVFIRESEIWHFAVEGGEPAEMKGDFSRGHRPSRAQSEQVTPERPLLLASSKNDVVDLLMQDQGVGSNIGATGTAPLAFSGSSRLNGQTANRQGSFSEVPQRSWTAELNPVLTLYGLPFTSSILLSSQQESNRQSINNFGLNFDLNRLREDLSSRLEGKIEELESSVEAGVPGADPEELNRLKDPENLKDNLDRFGMISGGEKFFMSIRSLGIGTNYPSYSEYTLSGVPVTGVNIEINPGIFYAAFTASANQRGIDNSSYSRSLYAGRIGLGKKEGTHLYFTGLYAKDDEGSIKLDPANNTLTPKANYVFGTEAKLNLFGDKLSLQGEGALAVLTRDTRDPELEHKSIPGWVKNLVDPRISTSFDYSYSGKLAFNNDASATRISLGIKMIGPGYTSLGVPNLRTDQFGYEGKIDQRLFENKFSIGTFFKQYKDNLIQWKRSTTKTTAFGINAGLNLPRLPFLRVTYSPYFQKNDDPNPARQIDNTTTMYSAMTGYSYPIAGLNSSSSFAFSHQQSKTNTGIADYRTDSYMLTEAVSFTFPVTVSASFGLIQSKSALGYGRINNVDVGVSGSLMENWSGTVGMNVAVERDRNKRTGFYLNSTILPLEGFDIDVRLDRNAYTDWQGDGDYDEVIISTGLVVRW